MSFFFGGRTVKNNYFLFSSIVSQYFKVSVFCNAADLAAPVRVIFPEIVEFFFREDLCFGVSVEVIDGTDLFSGVPDTTYFFIVLPP